MVIGTVKNYRCVQNFMVLRVFIYLRCAYSETEHSLERRDSPCLILTKR